ncbi:6766_t:CDS:2, partial [Gigaspora margarita]
ALYERLKENIPNLEFRKKHCAKGGATTTSCSPKNPNISECLQTKLKKITNNLNNMIIPMLKEAGGGGAQYAATTYFDIFPYHDLLANRLIDIYTENGFKVVDLRQIITNDTICNYTHWCKHHNGHPNVIGSHVIADVLLSKLLN